MCICYGVYFSCHFSDTRFHITYSCCFCIVCTVLFWTDQEIRYSLVWHIFGLGTILLYLGQPALWHLTVCIGLVLTLPNACVFPHFLCYSKFLNVAHYQKTLCNLKNRLIFLWCSLALSLIHLTLVIWSLVPYPLLNPDCSIGVSCPIYKTSGVFE